MKVLHCFRCTPSSNLIALPRAVVSGKMVVMLISQGNYVRVWVATMLKVWCQQSLRKSVILSTSTLSALTPPNVSGNSSLRFPTGGMGVGLATMPGTTGNTVDWNTIFLHTTKHSDLSHHHNLRNSRANES